jgi:hypothetical protein
LLPEAKVFDGNNVGLRMAALNQMRNSANAVVLTTSRVSKGVDFIFSVPQAFVLHLTFPTTLV